MSPVMPAIARETVIPGRTTLVSQCGALRRRTVPAPADLSRRLLIGERGGIMIDDGSAFRMQANVPLVVPEINADDLEWHERIVSIPEHSCRQRRHFVLIPLDQCPKGLPVAGAGGQGEAGDIAARLAPETHSNIPVLNDFIFPPPFRAAISSCIHIC